jgi:hypothetical protein
MRNSKDLQESQVTMTVNLARVVLDTGTVGHVLIQPWAYRQASGLGSMACHRVDSLRRHVWYEPSYGSMYAWRWATDEDPTCRRCLASLRAYIGGRLA